MPENDDAPGCLQKQRHTPGRTRPWYVKPTAVSTQGGFMDKLDMLKKAASEARTAPFMRPGFGGRLCAAHSQDTEDAGSRSIGNSTRPAGSGTGSRITSPCTAVIWRQNTSPTSSNCTTVAPTT